MLMSGYQRCVSQAASILQRYRQHLVVGTPKLWSSFANMEQPYDYSSHLSAINYDFTKVRCINVYVRTDRVGVDLGSMAIIRMVPLYCVNSLSALPVCSPGHNIIISRR